ncbi:MAG: hypothetical protein ACREQK_02685 [Candidatus Binatia bacterium]
MTDVVELTQVGDQSQALRSIGQALEEIHLDSFEIVTEGRELVIRAKAAALKKSARSEDREMGLGHLWRLLRNRYLAQQRSSRHTKGPLEMRYGREELVHLDRNRKSRFSTDPAKPDVYNLPEMLRLVGAYLDMKKAQLLRLSKREQQLTIKYRTERGEIKTENHDVASFYDLSVHLYLKRKKHAS